MLPRPGKFLKNRLTKNITLASALGACVASILAARLGARAQARLSRQIAEKEAQLRAARAELALLTNTFEERVRQRTAELSDNNRRLAMLHELDRTLLEGRSLEETGQQVLRELVDLAACDLGNIMVFEDSGRSRFLAAHRAVEASSDWQIEPPPDLAPGQAFAGAGMEHVADTDEQGEASEQTEILRAIGIRSFVNVPLVCQGQLLGSLNLGSRQPGHLPAAAQAISGQIADQLAAAIYQSQLRELQARHAAELEERVDERTAELKAANASLQEAAERLRSLDQLKSQFVSNVSHELRTPLTNIKLYLSLLDHGKPEKRAIYMETLQRETSLLQGLIEDLLDLSRLDAGQVKIDMAEVALAPLVETVVADRAALAAHRGLGLVAETQPDVPPVRGDRKMLVQVLSNLIANATNYTPSGGHITVSLQTEREEEQDWVTLRVSDTGPGIPDDERERVFERFYRGSAARTSGAPGTGLGLSICDEIIRRHSGRITVESSPGQGSAFTAWLPVAGQPGSPSDDRDASSPDTLSGSRMWYTT